MPAAAPVTIGQPRQTVKNPAPKARRRTAP